MRTFVYTDAKSNKFWNIEIEGKSFTVTFGKVGTKGQSRKKDFANEDKAQEAYDKLVEEKVSKGYVETTEVESAPASPLLESLEKALVEDPDDLAARSAYADYLMEQGDPRGELIQVQLALQDPNRKESESKKLQKREKELLSRYARQWLGDIGRFLVGKWSGEKKPYHYRFHLGWLDTVRLLPFSEYILASVAKAPEARLLRRLEIVYDMRYHPWDFDEFVQGPGKAIPEDEQPDEDDFYMYEPLTILPPILESPYLTNLRAFKLGFSDQEDELAHSTMVDPFGNCTTQQILDLLEKCPRIEELYLNTHFGKIGSLFASPLLENIRILQFYYGSDYLGEASGAVYPLSALAKNKSLKNLTTLRLHPGRDATVEIDELKALLQSPNLPALSHLQVHMTTYGNEGCESIVQSGILQRLKTLDIGYGTMTDEGATILAECPDLKNLELLDVSRNALSTQGINALKKTGVNVVAKKQHPVDDNDFLYEVDYE